jgi:hypothetical protein
MPTREHNPVPQQKGRRKPKPMETSPDDDEAQAGDQSHAADLGEPAQAKRRREQEMDREEEGDGDEAGGAGRRP